MSKEKWFHVHEEKQNSNGISILEREPICPSAQQEAAHHKEGVIDSWLTRKEENALSRTTPEEGIIDRLIEQEGEYVCSTAASEDKMSDRMHKIEAPFVSNIKFNRLGGTFRRC